MTGNAAIMVFALQAISTVMRLVLRARFVCALGGSLFNMSIAFADTLNRSHISELIRTTAQEIGQPFSGVHIEIVDPGNHMRSSVAHGEAIFDFSSLHDHINRQITVPLGFVEATTIGKHAAFAFFNREMATSLHALSDRSTLCTVFPMPAPVQFGELAVWLSGDDQSRAVASINFDAADVYKFLLYHEIAHCTEDLRRIRARGLSTYDVYLAENRADAFAVLMHMKRTGHQDLPRFMASIRRKGMTYRGDFEHQTADVIEPTIAFAANLHLTGFFNAASLTDIMRASRALTRNYALSRTEFTAQVRLQKVRQRSLP